MIGRLIYLMIIRLEISLLLGSLVHAQTNRETALRILAYIHQKFSRKEIVIKQTVIFVPLHTQMLDILEIEVRKSTSSYLTSVGGNLVTWQNKGQDVSRSSTKADY